MHRARTHIKDGASFCYYTFCVSRVWGPFLETPDNFEEAPNSKTLQLWLPFEFDLIKMNPINPSKCKTLRWLYVRKNVLEQGKCANFFVKKKQRFLQEAPLGSRGLLPGSIIIKLIFLTLDRINHAVVVIGLFTTCFGLFFFVLFLFVCLFVCLFVWLWWGGEFHLFRWPVIFVHCSVQQTVILSSREFHFHVQQTQHS